MSHKHREAQVFYKDELAGLLTEYKDEYVRIVNKEHIFDVHEIIKTKPVTRLFNDGHLSKF